MANLLKNVGKLGGKVLSGKSNTKSGPASREPEIDQAELDNAAIGAIESSRARNAGLNQDLAGQRQQMSAFRKRQAQSVSNLSDYAEGGGGMSNAFTGAALPFVGSFDEGGIVPGEPGQPVLAQVSGGEKITPPSMMDESGQQVVAPPVAALGQEAPAVGNPPMAAPRPLGPSAMLAAPRAPAKPGEMFKTMSHAFLGAVLGAVSGGSDEKITGYDVDPASGKMTARMAPRTSGDRVRDIIQASLSGLGAASQVEAQPGEEALAGFGAGRGAVRGEAEARDTKMRGEAELDFKNKQQADLLRATILTHNLNKLNMHMARVESSVKSDEQIKSDSIREASLKAAKIPIRYIDDKQLEKLIQDFTAQHANMSPEEAKQNFMAEHQILTLGGTLMLGPDGQPVLDENGQEKINHKIGMVDVFQDPTTKETMVKIGPALASEIKSYGNLVGFSPADVEKLGKDLEMPYEKLLYLESKMDNARKEVMKANERPEFYYDEKGKLMKRNPLNHEVLGPADEMEKAKLLQMQQKPLLTEEQIKLTQARTADVQAKTAELLKQQLISKGVDLTPELKAQIDGLSDAKQKILEPLDTSIQSSLMGVAFGNGEIDFDKVFPKFLRKGQPGLTSQQAFGYIHQLNPEWNQHSYKVKSDMYKDANNSSPRSLGGQADSLNNFIGHAAEVKHLTNKFWKIDPNIFKKKFNQLTTLGYNTDAVAMKAAITVVNAEFLTLVLSGHAATDAEKKAQATIMDENSTIGQINAALDVMANMAQTRADTLNNHYKRGTGVAFPNLINEDRISDAEALGIKVSRYKVGGRIGSSGTASQMQSSAEPGRQVGPLTHLNINPKTNQEIGWDGKKWVDTKTREEVK